MAVEPDSPQAHVRDDGPGFPAELLAVPHASGPERFRAGSPSDGTGLGLTIAVGQAGLIGARLSLRNRPQGGAEMVLCLSAGEPGSGRTLDVPHGVAPAAFPARRVSRGSDRCSTDSSSASFAEGVGELFPVRPAPGRPGSVRSGSGAVQVRVSLSDRSGCAAALSLPDHAGLPRPGGDLDPVAGVDLLLDVGQVRLDGGQ
ncbi:hypothetical protein SSP24_62140 [Streptomyces spinoverrucosus]|uniref:Histidine kinase/HSP90-like ATPase domain-containing protein n=1 Tax=Streptomyces spinoverrucosus TaxID=284043 RepID=A0A4Y3VSA7_9ACTN|nr:hypothetical protein SSP24_62140 [Streptomyces spinoverrucosus]GHB87807.1 hypothetical protein GCM10010397_69580 [Streptomyces spinoverrucosus]